MYISEELISLAKKDDDFKKILEGAADSLKSNLQNISSVDELLKAQKPTYKSKNLKIENDVLLKSRTTNGIVFIPEGVTEIAKDAFRYRDRGNFKIIFPETLKKIGDFAFDNCSCILELDVKSPERCYYKSTSNGGEIDQYSKGFSTFPSSLEEIGDFAFANIRRYTYRFREDLIEYLILPKTLKKIGDFAFSDSGIRAVYIAGPKAISEACFSSCPLRKVIFGENVKTIEKAAFLCCGRLERIVFGHNIKEIGDESFRHCSSIRRIFLPKVLKKIGKRAFMNCSSLTNIELPDSVIKIGEGSFSECQSLKKVKIGTGLTDIPKSCFLNCEKLQEIIIPFNVTKIAKNAFDNCPNLTIMGSTGSYAEQFAKENDIKFKDI